MTLLQSYTVERTVVLHSDCQTVQLGSVPVLQTPSTENRGAVVSREGVHKLRRSVRVPTVMAVAPDCPYRLSDSGPRLHMFP
jgi:hypothetical protein